MLLTQRVVATVRVCEPGADYRARYDRDGGVAITRRAERAVARGNRVEVGRLLALAARFSDRLSGAERALWLDLEEALHAYWLEVAVAHYDLGAAAALLGSKAASGEGPARARLYAVAQALLEIADGLE